MRFYYQFSFVLGSQIHQHRVLEASWGCLEGVLGVFGASRGCLGTSWARLGVSWSVLEPSWSVLEPSWSRLGAVLERLEAVCGALSDSDPPTTCQQLSGPSRQGGGRGRVNPPPGSEDWRIGGIVVWLLGSTRREAQGLGGFPTFFDTFTNHGCPQELLQSGEPEGFCGHS